MPVAKTRLEIAQIVKALQCVRTNDLAALEKLANSGVPFILNFNDPISGEYPLGIAASQGNAELVRNLIALGAHPDAVDFEGRSALMLACERGNVPVVDVLCAKQADVNASDAQGRNALFYCLCEGELFVNCARSVINAKPDFDRASNDGRTALIATAQSGLDSIVRELLAAKANPNFANPTNGSTALMAACSSGSETVARLLLESGADVNALDNVGRHAAHYAAQSRHVRLLLVLSAFGANFDQTDKKGFTPIHLAAEKDGPICRFLATRGCNPKTRNDEGQTAKAIAKETGKKKLVREIVKAEKQYEKMQASLASGDVCVTVSEPWALRLHDYVLVRKSAFEEEFARLDPEGDERISREAFARALTALGVPLPPNFTDKCLSHLTTAHSKTSKKEPDAEPKVDYELFLSGKKYIGKLYRFSAFEKTGKKKKKKKKRKAVKKKKPPFGICVMQEFMLNQRTENGGPPELYIEREQELTDMARARSDDDFQLPPLRKFGVGGSSSESEEESGEEDIEEVATDERAAERARRAREARERDRVHRQVEELRAGVQDEQNRAERAVARAARVEEENPLRSDTHWYLDPPDRIHVSMVEAARDGDIDSIRRALDRGHPVDVRDKFYKTPLMAAAGAGNLEIVQLLLERKADVNLRDNFYWTAMHHACLSGNITIVELLLKCGAKLEAKAMNGATPLFRAIQSGHSALVDYMINQLRAKVQIENRKEQTPMDFAEKWGDARVQCIVKTKWDSLPPMDDKKKGGRRPKKKAASAS